MSSAESVEQASVAKDVTPCACILHALPEEATHFDFVRGALKIERLKGQPSVAEEVPAAERKIVLSPGPMTFCIGVGMHSAAANTRLLLQSDLKISCLLIVGFAGGLQSRCEPGDVIVANAVRNSVTQENYLPDSALLKVAESVRFAGKIAQQGPLITENRVLTTRSEKQKLAQGTGALAVDMETAGVVQVAEAQQVPWLAVRVVTDGVDDDLPLDFNAFTRPDGTMDKKRIVAATLTHPWKIPALIRLGKRSSLAATNLAAFLNAYLNALPDRQP